jgi:hypothetical protein
MARAPHDTTDRDLSVLNEPELGDLSPDGRAVLFIDFAYGVTRGVYLRRLDGSPAVRLGDGSAALALSPDGKWAATETEQPYQLILLPTGPGEPRTLPRGAIQAINSSMWLPDGHALILDAREPGHAWRGYLLTIDGSAPRPITPEHIEPLLVSPDGRFVLASGPDRARSMALYAVGGGAPRPVLGLDPADAPVQWSTDPNVLFVRAPGRYPARVFRFNMQTSRKESWKEFVPADEAGLFSVGSMEGERSLLITPDGASYVYRYTRSLSDLYLVNGLK